MKNYESIGSTGYACLGDPDYDQKAVAEGRVLKKWFLANYPVPDDYKDFTQYLWKAFPHDFGIYWELVIIWDEEQLTPTRPYKPFFSDDFWEWVLKVTDVYIEEEPFQLMVEKEYNLNFQPYEN